MAPRPAPSAAAASLLLSALGGPASLADHTPLGAQDPSAQEQLGIYEINRARSDPARYGTEIGFDLSVVAAQPPLAVNRNLTGSARFHAEEMLGHHYYAHTSAVTGDGPNAMAVQNGYDPFGNGLGFDWGSTNTIESNARGVNRYPSIPGVIEDLVVDEGVAGAGHRVHLLAMASQYQSHREIGVGRAEGTDSFPEFGFPKNMPVRTYSFHTAYEDSGTQFVTGVVFADANGNLRYDAGEGIGGADVLIGETHVTTLEEGGYSWEASPGTYLVSCSGGGFSGTARAFVTVGSDNVEVDFHSGRPAGEVGFAWQDGTIPAGPTVSITVDDGDGLAPLDVEFIASGLEDGAYAWDFGDGVGDEGDDPSHQFAYAAFFPVVLTGVDGTGADAALRVITVEGAAGAGPGTTPPSDRSLRTPKATVSRKFKVPGKDAATLSATIELPAGFAPEGKHLSACIAGVVRNFQLDAAGRGTDEGLGGTVVLKAKWPKDGSGVAAGTLAKVTVKVKGDLSGILEALGLRNATESSNLGSVLLGVMLEELPYTAEPGMTATSVAGKAGKGTIATGD